MTATTTAELTASEPEGASNKETSSNDIVGESVEKQISKQVLRQKLSKLRHLVLPKGISPDYLDSLFPQLLKEFDPQQVTYNFWNGTDNSMRAIKSWKEK
jgi:hypothetical protein